MKTKLKKSLLVISKISKGIFIYLFFGFIFILYTTNAAGLYNSIDTPSFFTTEAIRKYGDVNVGHFGMHPRYFVYPDIIYKNGETLGLRGYLVSILTLPMHYVSRNFESLLNTNNFSKALQSSPYFAYELGITMLYTLYTLGGVVVFYYFSLAVFKSRKLPILITFLLAVGTPLWQYSAMYIRQPVTVGIASLLVFLLYKHVQTFKSKYLFFVILLTSLLFGIDTMMFIATSVGVFVYLLFVLGFYKKIQKSLRTELKVEPVWDNKRFYLGLAKASIACLVVVGINIYFNLKFYGTVMFSQMFELPMFVRELGLQKAKDIMLSTPLWPTVPAVLFNSASHIDPGAFSNLAGLPESFIAAIGARYAMTENFDGLFTVSPFLLFGVFAIFAARKQFWVFVLSLTFFIIFILGVALNTKVIGFWGGPQYDIRYFYPYMIFMAALVVFGLKYIANYSNIWFKTLSYFVFACAGFYSVIIGIISVLSMYLPNLAGNKRLLIGSENMYNGLSLIPFEQIISALLPNRENIFAAAIIYWFICCVALFIFGICTTRIAKKIAHYLD